MGSRDFPVLIWGKMVSLVWDKISSDSITHGVSKCCISHKVDEDVRLFKTVFDDKKMILAITESLMSKKPVSITINRKCGYWQAILLN